MRDADASVAKSALHTLESAGIDGRLGLDGNVQLRRQQANHTFTALVAGHLRSAHLPALLETMRHLPQPAILLARYAPTTVAGELARGGVNFVDTAGNAHIDHDGWFVSVTGRRPPKTKVPSTLSASVWAVAYALLREPALGEVPIRRLAHQAGVSPGGTSKAIRALERRGWVSNHRRKRLVVRPHALWRAWEGDDPDFSFAGVEYGFDADGDGYGSPASTIVACSGAQPLGYVPMERGEDCDDAVSTTHPDATETCNAIDDDCDAGPDNGLLFLDYFADAEGNEAERRGWTELHAHGDGCGSVDVSILRTHSESPIALIQRTG